MFSQNLPSNMVSLEDMSKDEETHEVNCEEEITDPLERQSISKTYAMDSVVYTTTQRLLGLYRRYIGKNQSTNDSGSEDVPQNNIIIISSGGLQSLLSQQATGDSEAESVVYKKCGFHNLPDSLHLAIFDCLTVGDLCVIAAVSRHWFMLSHDEILWKRRLTHNQNTWTQISHLTNPDVFQECCPELSSKEIYLRCTSEVLSRRCSGITSRFHQVGSYLSSFLPQSAPKLAMVGPGMEAGTRGLARAFLDDKNNTFTTTGIVSGAFGGVGAGFSLRTSCGINFDLSPFYTNEAKNMNRNSQRRWMEHNRLFVNAAADGDEVVPELSPHARLFCRSIDGLIYVIDAKSSGEEMRSNICELSTLLRETSHDHPVPLLVLNCTSPLATHSPPDSAALNMPGGAGAASDTASRQTPVVSVMRHLRLTSIANPWMISDCSLSDSSSILPSLQWLVGQANSR